MATGENKASRSRGSTPKHAPSSCSERAQVLPRNSCDAHQPIECGTHAQLSPHGTLPEHVTQ